MNKKILITLIFSGNIFIFSACDQLSENKQSNVVTTTTSGTTSGSGGSTTTQSPEMSALEEAMHTTMNQMKDMEMTGDPDQDFAAMMIMHHEGGIKMAEEEINTGKNEELVSLAKKIKEGQEKEKAELKKLTSQQKTTAPNKAFMEEMKKNMQMSESDMHQMMMTGNIDEDFATMMTKHHENGINLAKTEVKYGKNQKVKALAQKSIDRQKKEIQQLESQASVKK